MSPVPPQLAGPRKGSSEANKACETGGKKSKAGKVMLIRRASRARKEVRQESLIPGLNKRGTIKSVTHSDLQVPLHGPF